jgi:hypothetical protein
MIKYNVNNFFIAKKYTKTEKSIKTKICTVCSKEKDLKENFRVVNAVTGYRSKKCHVCACLDNTCRTEGFLYVVFDSAFPAYIKIGHTIDKVKRLQTYNKNRPLNTCNYVYVSQLLTDAFKLEQKILSRIYRYTYSMPDRKEWFLIDYKEKIIEEIKIAEADISNHPNIKLQDIG